MGAPTDTAGAELGRAGEEVGAPVARPRGRKAGGGQRAAASWLLRSPEWLNSLLTERKESFLQMLGVPKGALFVSARADDGGKGSFIKWAREASAIPTCGPTRGSTRGPTVAEGGGYLESRGAPVLLLRPGANTMLFSEASEFDCRVLCVSYLLREPIAHAPTAVARRRLVEQLLKYAKLERHFTAHAHPSISIVLAHRDHIDRTGNVIGPLDALLGCHVFVPAAGDLTRVGLLQLIQRLQDA
eukprot:2427132-Prymnesium_polylepis.1